MKIEQPIESIEHIVPRSVYAPVYEAVAAANGAWVPVVCESEQEAMRLYEACCQRRRSGRIELKKRKLTVYIRLAQPVAAPIALVK